MKGSAALDGGSFVAQECPPATEVHDYVVCIPETTFFFIHTVIFFLPFVKGFHLEWTVCSKVIDVECLHSGACRWPARTIRADQKQQRWDWQRSRESGSSTHHENSRRLIMYLRQSWHKKHSHHWLTFSIKYDRSASPLRQLWHVDDGFYKYLQYIAEEHQCTLITLGTRYLVFQKKKRSPSNTFAKL